ncbi:MAG: putative ABC exporter domain-containing protein [bacterium]|jgi:hypothetical protein
MREFKLLARRDGWTIINYGLEIRRNPKRLGIYLLYLVWLGTMVINSVLNYRNPALMPMELGPSILGAGFTVYSTIFILYFLYQGTREASTFFTMGDVNLLFPAPVSPRRVLLYSMVKQSLLNFFLYGFVVLAFMRMLMNIARIDLQYFSYLYCGFIGLLLTAGPLSFLVFALGSKYGIQVRLQQGILTLSAVFSLYLAGKIVTAGSVAQGLLQGLNAPFFLYAPVVGWSKAAVMTAFTGYRTYSTTALYLQLFFLLGCIALSYNLADDYYEDVQKATEKRNLRKKRKAGLEKDGRPSLAVYRRRNVVVSKTGTGARALFWRRKVEASRSDLHPYFGLSTIMLLLAGAVVGLVSGRYAAGITPMCFANGIVAYIIFIFAAANAGRHELTKPYIYLIPGSNLLKLINSNLMDVVRMSVNILALNIPLGIILHVPAATVLTMIVFVISFYVLNLSSNFLIRAFFSNALDQKAFFPLFLMLQVLLLILPGLVAGGILAAVFRNLLLVFAGITAVNIIIIGLLLLLADTVFNRLEWK